MDKCPACGAKLKKTVSDSDVVSKWCECGMYYADTQDFPTEEMLEERKERRDQEEDEWMQYQYDLHHGYIED